MNSTRSLFLPEEAKAVLIEIYLQENLLVREPLRPEHIKPRLLGHWGTSRGLIHLGADVGRGLVAPERAVQSALQTE